MTYKLKPSKKSIKNFMLLSYLIVSIFSGIVFSLMFHNVMYNTLIKKGIEKYVTQNHFILTTLGVIGVGVIIILAIAFYISRKISEAIKELTDGTIDIANGKLDTRIKINSHAELSRLAKGFNYMAEHIDKSLKKLAAAKDYNDNIVVSVPSILIVLNNRLNILSTNMAFEKINKQYPSLTLKDFVAHLTKDIQQNIKTGETIHNEVVIVPTDTSASLIFASTISSIGQDENGSDTEKAHILMTLTDITERRKMKELVMQSMQDWEDTFNAIPDMITIQDKDYNIIHANKAAKEILNLNNVSPNQNNKCFKHYHGTDHVPKDCPSCNCLKTGQPVTFEIFEPHLSKFIEIRSMPRFNKENELIGQLHIGRDISIRKKIEKEHSKLLMAVTKAKIEWEMTFDSTLEHIVIIDKNLIITRCNKSFSDYVNMPVNDIIGHYCFKFLHCSGQTAEECKNCMDNSKELPLKSELQTPSGRWLYVSHRPIIDEKGRSSQSIIVATDITEIKSTQGKLNDSRETLKNKISDLERFYDMAVGRELKMKQLKKEIKKLTLMLENDNLTKNALIEK